MSHSWASLAEQCDKAANKCSWCNGFGHKINDCPKYLTWLVERQIKDRRLAEMQRGADRAPSGLLYAAMGILTACAYGLYLLLR